MKHDPMFEDHFRRHRRAVITSLVSPAPIAGQLAAVILLWTPHAMFSLLFPGQMPAWITGQPLRYALMVATVLAALNASLRSLLPGLLFLAASMVALAFDAFPIAVGCWISSFVCAAVFQYSPMRL